MPKIVDREEMQTRILDAAASCFMTQGFHVTKMDDVARAAQMAKGTLYLYFKGKDELMLALLRRYFGEIQTRIAQLPAPQTLEQFLHGVRLSMPTDGQGATSMFFDVLGPGFQDPRAVEVIGGFFDWLGDIYGDQFRALADRGEVRRDLDPGQAGRTVVAMLDGLTIHLALFNPDPQAFAARRDAAISILATGLGPASPTQPMKETP
ncbi:TetR/AcrR family transcriptional regulator [Phaeobacter marinintestinus]|uniref:TetR/AcrR family transcriptional regulator n=1 Tax=Falsiphaeobacter marinintestinus TaxID=1492905 RepID=UPI0011B80B88|nr:TetR/AcrR family transcriptional regulator [Phaeobacter marinintestinus]